ncbi:MAG: IS3 family transposase [Marichromatium sp.]|nr:IS3 family transposase [Marichromatium sp.]
MRRSLVIAPTESWLNSFKHECVFGERFPTREAMRATAFESIEVFYNRKRLHSTLGYRSPRRVHATVSGEPAPRPDGRMRPTPWGTKYVGTSRMDWTDFLSSLDTGLSVLERRLQDLRGGEAEASRLIPPVCFKTRQGSAGGDRCYIGCGEPAAAEDTGLYLNNKLYDRDAVTRLVLDPDRERQDRWRSLLGADAPPERFFGRFTLVVEDASPDSCLGLILFLARQNGVAADDLPGDWIRYTLQWERGASRVSDPLRAWGPLLSALAHGHWSVESLQAAALEGRPQSVPEALAPGQAWLSCLRFTLALLLAGQSPEAIDELPNCEESERAYAFLRYEWQVYLQALEHAERLQLLLPMQGDGRRYKVVDACLLDEMALCGAKKIFLRNDRTHTYLGDGFGLMALYRPAETGTGNDMTISVDPIAGVHLRDLWERLEYLEDERWEGQRPNDAPRALKSYPGGRRPDGAPSPNQPWWDDHGRHTLIGAPRRLADGRLGSCLEWSPHVLEALWDCYEPTRSQRFIDGSGQLKALADCVAEPVADTGKRQLSLKWPRSGQAGAEAGLPPQGYEPALITPTFQRCLAACLQPGGREARRLANLPCIDSFDFLQVPGGYVLIHAEGVLVLDDWRSMPLCEEAVDAEITKVAERLHLLRETGKRAQGLFEQISRHLVKRRWRKLGSMTTLDRLAEIKLRMRAELNRTAPVTDDAHITAFRQALECRWAIASKIETIDRTIDDLEQSLRSYTELRAGRLINFLTFIGFPLALFASFFPFIFEGMPRDWTALLSWIGVEDQAPDTKIVSPHWVALWFYLGVSIASMLVIGAGWKLWRLWEHRLADRRGSMPS